MYWQAVSPQPGYCRKRGIAASGVLPQAGYGEHAMLKVWGRRSSFNVQKVMWLVDELELPHEHIDAGGKFGGLDAPDFLAMNPHGKVPVIDDDGIVVWESHAILRFLAARYGGMGRVGGVPPA